MRASKGRTVTISTDHGRGRRRGTVKKKRKAAAGKKAAKKAAGPREKLEGVMHRTLGMGGRPMVVPS